MNTIGSKTMEIEIGIGTVLQKGHQLVENSDKLKKIFRKHTFYQICI